MIDQKIYLALFLFIGLIFLFCFIYLISEQSVQSGTENKNYTEPVLKLYYTNWCGWSKKFLPVWDQLNNLKQISIPMKKIDCEKNKDQCNGIPGFPYVVIERGNNRIEYKGNRTAKDIINFVKTNVK